jgi:hypothetical protein
VLFVGALVGVAPQTAAASPAPTSCDGQVVAFTNHISGSSGASDSASASAGPGYFLGPETSAGIAAVRNEFCE